MKNLRPNLDDSLRPEYKRSDFGEMVQGKFANTQVAFAELVSVLIACIGEDEDVKFIHHSPGNYLAGHKSGDWSYELDNADQITLRYWIGEFRNIAEPISNQPSITTPQERSDLHDLILSHVRTLKDKVAQQ
jgi:hypothetical protein